MTAHLAHDSTAYHHMLACNSMGEACNGAMAWERAGWEPAAARRRRGAGWLVPKPIGAASVGAMSVGASGEGAMAQRTSLQWYDGTMAWGATAAREWRRSREGTMEKKEKSRAEEGGER